MASCRTWPNPRRSGEAASRWKGAGLIGAHRRELRAPTRGPRAAQPGRRAADNAGVLRWLSRPLPVLTMADVQRRDEALQKSGQGICVTAHGRVYEVPSAFIAGHPADATAMRRRGGTDVTRDFDFHGKRAQARWAEFQVGRLAPEGWLARLGRGTATGGPAAPRSAARPEQADASSSPAVSGSLTLFGPAPGEAELAQ